MKQKNEKSPAERAAEAADRFQNACGGVPPEVMMATKKDEARKPEEE